jgi:hypothetical protein
MTPLRPPKVLLWLVIGLFMAAVCGLVPFAITKRQKATRTLICDQCGIRTWISTDELVGSSAPAKEQRTFQNTELSRWFASHITTNCQHTWRLNHSSGQTYVSVAGLRLWTISGTAGSSPTPLLVYLSPDDRARLESLFRQSPDACRSFIHARLKGADESDGADR